MPRKDPIARREYQRDHYAANKAELKARRDARMQERVEAGEVCGFEGCMTTPQRRGWCTKHYTRWMRYGDPSITSRESYQPGQKCSVPECDRLAFSRGWCQRHWTLWRRNGVPELQPARTAQWRVDGSGYVTKLVEIDGVRRRLSQHRVVMEEVLGRPLTSHETVHHVNGGKADNRPANLELWSSSHPAGQRVVDLIEWANQLIALYGADGKAIR